LEEPLLTPEYIFYIIADINIGIYRRDIMDLPNEKTLEIIEERKKYLLEKVEKSNNKNSFILREIKALDKVINLIKLIQSNFSDDLIKKTVEEKLIENNNDEETEEYKGYKILYSYEQEISKNNKLEISFLKYEYDSKGYIHIALKKYRNNLLKWIYQGKIKLTPSILEDILNKSHEIGMK
jgi:hypothetical protein